MADDHRRNGFHGSHFTPEQRQAWYETTAKSPFNRWLDAQAKRVDGTLDLDRLHELARRYGIDRQAEYAHLNPGQQRMNVGNILRRIVPASDYEVGVRLDISAPAPALAAPAPPPERPDVIRTSPVRGLLVLHGQIMDELRDRNVVRTGNAPLGDYAELLFATAFGWSLQRNSSSGFDASDDQGVRYQIKSRRVTPRNPSRQLSAIRKLPERKFDFLAGALFDEQYCVTKAILIPHELVAARAKHVEHTNSWRFLLEDHVWRLSGTRDVTAEVAKAANLTV